MRKYQSVEKTEVVSSQGHKDLEEEVKRVGKTSAAQLTDSERKQVDLDKR